MLKTHMLETCNVPKCDHHVGTVHWNNRTPIQSLALTCSAIIMRVLFSLDLQSAEECAFIGTPQVNKQVRFVSLTKY